MSLFIEANKLKGISRVHNKQFSFVEYVYEVNQNDISICITEGKDTQNIVFYRKESILGCFKSFKRINATTALSEVTDLDVLDFLIINIGAIS